MYNYQLGYADWDGVGEIILQHEKKFTPEEFLSHIADVAPDAVRQSGPRLANTDLRFHVIWPYVIRLLVERHGYQHIDVEARHIFSGDVDLLELTVEDSWEYDPKLNVVIQAILDELEVEDAT